MNAGQVCQSGNLYSTSVHENNNRVRTDDFLSNPKYVKRNAIEEDPYLVVHFRWLTNKNPAHRQTIITVGSFIKQTQWCSLKLASSWHSSPSPQAHLPNLSGREHLWMKRLKKWDLRATTTMRFHVLNSSSCPSLTISSRRIRTRW